MKSKWLPTFPLHAANWLADPRVQMLDPVAKSNLLEALLRSWMLGKAVAVGTEIAEAYAELWPEYEVVLQEHTALREKRAELGKLGNERRWSQKGSPGDRNSDPLAIAKASQRGSPGDRTRVDRTPTPTPTITQTQTITQSPTPSSPKGRRGTRLPDDAVLTDEWRQVAIEEGIKPADIDRLFRGFVSYWAALPGQKATKLDWKATWRNRCISVAPQFKQQNAPDRPAWKNSLAPVEARQNIPNADETRARLKAEDEERRRQELRAQVRRVAS